MVGLPQRTRTVESASGSGRPSHQAILPTPPAVGNCGGAAFCYDGSVAAPIACPAQKAAMSDETLCPSHEELSAFVLGKLAPEQEEALCLHLGACAGCEARLQQLEG